MEYVKAPEIYIRTRFTWVWCWSQMVSSRRKQQPQNNTVFKPLPNLLPQLHLQRPSTCCAMRLKAGICLIGSVSNRLSSSCIATTTAPSVSFDSAVFLSVCCVWLESPTWFIDSKRTPADPKGKSQWSSETQSHGIVVVEVLGQKMKKQVVQKIQINIALIIHMWLF